MSSVLPFQSHLPLNPQSLPVRARLSRLCKDGRPDLARHMFDALPRPVPTVLWNTLLIGFACNSMPFDALALYALMNASPATQPDHYTYSSALKACADSRQLRLGRSVHCRIVRCLEKPKNRVLHNSLLNMYTSCLEFPRADVVEKVFDTMPKRNVVSWNTLIAWYAKNSLAVDALDKFKAMMEAGIMPTSVSFVNVFPAVAGIGAKRIADALYGLAVKYGSEVVLDLFVVSSAIAMYSELSDVESARRVFDSALAKNIEVWNSMIGACVENDQPDEAVDLFIRIFESCEDIHVDMVTLLEALMAVSQLQAVGFGQQIHAYVIKNKNLTSLPIMLLNALMAMYSRCDLMNDAFDLFHQMEERDIVSWNTMISSLVQNDMNSEGVLLAYQMQKDGYGIDSVTVTALLSAASNLGDIRIGRETHGYLIRHGIQCVGLNSYLIDMYSKSGFVMTARGLFETDRSCERDPVTWNAMIAGYSQSGHADAAISVLRQMPSEDIEPNSVTLSSILPACSLIGGGTLGKQIHGYALRRCLDENTFVGTALVDMYSKCGKIAYAEHVFNGMYSKNSVTYTTMISSYGQHGLGDKAMSLFRIMLDSGMKPDGVTFVAVMSACSYTGLVEEGLEIFQSMEKEYGIRPTPEHHCCVVDMLGRAGRVEEAYEYASELGDEGNVVGIWGSLLAACKIYGKFELGKVVAERLFGIEKEGGQAGYHVLLSNVYAAERNWKSVDNLRKNMRERGLTKEPGSSWIGLGDVTHKFVSKDQSHVDQEQIREILEDLVAEMKLSGYKPIVDGYFDEEVESPERV